jgi:hypothetical protein
VEDKQDQMEKQPLKWQIEAEVLQELIKAQKFTARLPCHIYTSRFTTNNDFTTVTNGMVHCFRDTINTSTY